MLPRLLSPPRDGSLTAPLPTLAALNAALPSISAAAPDASSPGPAMSCSSLTAPPRSPPPPPSPSSSTSPNLLSPKQSPTAPPSPPRAPTSLLPANPRAAFRKRGVATGVVPPRARLRAIRGHSARARVPEPRRGPWTASAPRTSPRMREDTARAVELPHLAALRASLLYPQLAYVFGLILLSRPAVVGAVVPCYIRMAGQSAFGRGAWSDRR
ncbi:hypothetical protein C8R46DRAFT_1206583 [Mycena filopes]|nr:hypothetical protein C8R46DRAFT_1206583 [Mycena filopes]